MESCYIPNNPQFGISLEYTTYNGGFAGYGHLACDTGQEATLCCEPGLELCTCATIDINNELSEFRDCENCEEHCRETCQQGLSDLNEELGANLINDEDRCSEGTLNDLNNDFSGDLSENCAQSGGVNVNGETVNSGYWTGEDMGSFSLPSLDLDPLPSLFPFSPCSGNYNRVGGGGGGGGGGGECRERGGDAADVLLSLKHAVVHSDCGAEPGHPQVLVSPSSGGYPYYEQYGTAAPLFPTMSVNVSMNMTMHGYPPDQMCPQVQWNQNASQPVNMMYPQPQGVISPSAYPSASYSFTADFRGNQVEPLITATSTFKPLPIPPPPVKTGNYGLFQQQQAFSSLSQKSLTPGVTLRRASTSYQGLNQQTHAQEYVYPTCVSAEKVQVGSLSGCSEEDDQKPNLCRICGKTYARPSTLKTHLRTHSGERPYRCGDCNKSFSQAANLTAHVRTHTGQKPFRCPICDRRFSQSSSVTTHMRTHSGERPYRCRACKKAFSDSSTLTKHLRIHSGEKPYQCKMCLLRFSQSGNLNRHMRVHGNNAALLG